MRKTRFKEGDVAEWSEEFYFATFQGGYNEN